MLTPRVDHLGSLQNSARYDSIGRNIKLSFYLRSQTSIVLPLRVLKILRGSTLRTTAQIWLFPITTFLPFTVDAQI